MPIYKNEQFSGPFKVGSIGTKANIAAGEYRDGLLVDNKILSVNSSHPIHHLGIQCDNTMPHRYIEEIKKDKGLIEKNPYQSAIRNYMRQKSIGFNPNGHNSVYTDLKGGKEINYYQPRVIVQDNEVKDLKDYDICLKGTCKSLSVDVENVNFESYFNISERGILEFDNLNWIELEIYFLRDMPSSTVVDVVWLYKN